MTLLGWHWGYTAALVLLVHAAAMVRVVLRPHRQPESRLAWVLVLLLLPGLGLCAYLLLGETRIGSRRAARLRAALDALPAPSRDLPPNCPRGSQASPTSRVRSTASSRSTATAPC